MIPAAGSPQVLALRDLEEIRAVLAGIRVSSGGVDIMESKALFRVVRVTDIDVRAASILKQEMLSAAERSRPRERCTRWGARRPTA